MDQDHLHHRSHLFTLRLWAEDIGDGQTEWRGRVQQVTSGEAHYFRDWPTLIAHLLKMLPQADGLADGTVTAIAIDAAGHPWFGTRVEVSELILPALSHENASPGESKESEH